MGPIKVLRITFDHGYRVCSSEDVTALEDFARVVEPLARILFDAKARGELWPPAPRADAAIAEADPRDSVNLDWLSRTEFEHIVCERFLSVEAIATISLPNGPPGGFSCISRPPPARLEEMGRQFGVSLRGTDLLAEFSYIERGKFGLMALDYLGCYLLLWRVAQLPSLDGVRVLGVSLETQTASIQKLSRAGFEEIGRHVIPHGHERGRTLLLFALALTPSLVADIAASYRCNLNRVDVDDTPAQ